MEEDRKKRKVSISCVTIPKRIIQNLHCKALLARREKRTNCTHSTAKQSRVYNFAKASSLMVRLEKVNAVIRQINAFSVVVLKCSCVRKNEFNRRKKKILEQIENEREYSGKSFSLSYEFNKCVRGGERKIRAESHIRGNNGVRKREKKSAFKSLKNFRRHISPK